MKVPLRSKPSVVNTLINREYGTPSPLWTSCLILRLSMFNSNRKWTLVGKNKNSCVVDFNYDLQWITLANSGAEIPCSEMRRIHTNGIYQVLYQLSNVQRIRVLYIYDLPHPVYKSSLPDHEYRPSIIALRKPNVLTRHDMEKGILYDEIYLGKIIMKNLSWNSSLDQLILSSSKYKNSSNDWTITFKIFKLHPLLHLATLAISAKVFPDSEDKRKYGQLRSSEIDGSFLLVMTEKSYTLIYSIEDVLKLIPDNVSSGTSCAASVGPYQLEEAPKVLFATVAHMDILSFGGSPWMYVRSVNDGLLEVKDLQSEELIEGGRVCFKENEQKISPDYLTFHMDDSNRLIHVKNSDLRILRIENMNGKSRLRQEFQYSKQQQEGNEQNPVTQSSCTTRFGRRVQLKVALDHSQNRSLAFGMESDLNLFFILEMQPQMAGVELTKLTFYDNNTYKVIQELALNLHVSGDIEDNTVSVFMEKDILSIVTKRQNLYTHFMFRLTYDQSNEEDKSGKVLKSSTRTWSLRRRRNVVRMLEQPRPRRRSWELNSTNSDEDDGLQEEEWKP